MKKLLSFFMLMCMCLVVHAVDMYNTIATAYVTTTISQNVVFDSTMQQGGAFTFSVLAHNGGGRPGQSDTANVKIQFYTSSGSLVSSVNSSYSNNLPNPNGTPGNPWTDPAVPWTTLTTSATLSAAQASSVAYATISMYGIDGSYWAGDYGPWYRAPTFTLNGSSNKAYNPEFGPYNGVTAQGWTSSPGFGACQGAWGGSNACIVNSSGQPGTSTTGLVANQNGGGPSATGGTTSGQAGGYNSAMSTSNPTGPPPAPPAPAGPKFTDLKFSRNQIADTQWNVGSCTNAGGTNCQIYSKSPGPTWNTGSPIYPSSTQYIAFQASGDATYPWRMYLYNNDGSFVSDLGTGQILSQGTGSDGHHYFFFSNANYNGTLFCTDWGMNNTDGVTINGTNNPTVPQTDTFASSGSTTPLDAGATAGGGTAAPTVTGTSTSDSVSSSSSVGATVTTSNPYNWNGNTYTVIGTGTPTTITTTTTPVTTTTWSDGTTTKSNGTSTTTSTTTWSYTVTGPANPPVSPYVGTNTNGVYINQVIAGASNNITTDQSGHGNYEGVSLGGSNNIVRLGQGYTFSTTGVASESNTASNYNLSAATVSGNFNGVVNSQVGNSNSAILSATGTYNSLLATQTGNNNQVYSTLSGNNNSLSFGQTGNGNIAAANLYGNNNVASISQTGNNHGAVLNLINAGGANNVSVVQTGNGDAYSLQQICTNPAGCSVSVIRNK